MSKLKKIILALTGCNFSFIISSFQFMIRVKTECESQYGACPKELESGILNLESG